MGARDTSAVLQMLLFFSNSLEKGFLNALNTADVVDVQPIYKCRMDFVIIAIILLGS